MRSLLVFPVVNCHEALRRLSVTGVRTDLAIGVSEPNQQVLAWAEVIDDLREADFTSDDIVELERVAGFRPTWGIEIAVSGDFEDWRQRDLRTLTTWLLAEGGCATSIELDEFKTADGWREHWGS